MLRKLFLISLFWGHFFFLNLGCSQISNDEERESEIKESSSALRTVSLKLVIGPDSFLHKFKKPYNPTSLSINVLNQKTLETTTIDVDMNAGPIKLELLAGDIYDFYVAAYGGLPGTDPQYSGSLRNELISASTTEIAISLYPLIMPSPSIISGSFSGDATSNVTLSAEINPNGNYTVAYFEWWSRDSIYKNRTKLNILGIEEVPITVTEQINGLSSLTTYYFRVVAESSNNITFGQEQPFTTKPNMAVMSWQPPATDEKGDILTDLAGYKIYRHTDTQTTTTVIDVGNLPADSTTGLVTYTISSLPLGTQYFYVTAYDTSGNESISTIEVSKLLD